MYIYSTFLVYNVSIKKNPIPVLIHVIVRPSHNEQSWKNVNKHSSYPGCHGMGLRCPKMNIKYNHSHTYTAK